MSSGYYEKYCYLPAMSGVYSLRCGIKIYIGYSKNIRNRVRRHFELLKAGKHISKNLQNDYNTGLDVNAYILEITPDKNKEYELTLKARESFILYNDNIGNKRSEEYKKRMSEFQRRPEILEKTSKGRNGRIVSQETRDKISSANMGKTFSSEHLKHLSESHKGNIPWNRSW